MDDDNRAEIEEFVARHVRGGGVLGHYIVIAEVVDSDGITLNFATSRNVSPWTAIGMVETVLDMMSIGSMDRDEYGGDET